MHRSLYSIDRKKLYKEVWEEPVIKVAERYNISNVGLKKICNKMSIPVPGPGHWTKVKSGMKIERPKLPKYNGPKLANAPVPEISDYLISLKHSISQHDEERKFEQLKSEALDWQLAMTIRNYIHAVETRVLTMRIPQSEKIKIRNRLKWAKQKADWLDPVTAFEDPLLYKKLYKRLFFDE